MVFLFDFQFLFGDHSLELSYLFLSFFTPASPSSFGMCLLWEMLRVNECKAALKVRPRERTTTQKPRGLTVELLFKILPEPIYR